MIAGAHHDKSVHVGHSLAAEKVKSGQSIIVFALVGRAPEQTTASTKTSVKQSANAADFEAHRRPPLHESNRHEIFLRFLMLASSSELPKRQDHHEEFVLAALARMLDNEHLELLPNRLG